MFKCNKNYSCLVGYNMSILSRRYQGPPARSKALGIIFVYIERSQDIFVGGPR